MATIDESDEGKTVVNADGETVGTVVDVDNNTANVDPDHEFGLLMDMLLVSTYAEIHGREIKPARSMDRRLYNSSIVLDRITSEGEGWGPLRKGLLDGSTEQAKELVDYLTANPRDFC